MHLATKAFMCFLLAMVAVNVVSLATDGMRFVHRHFLLRQRDLAARYGADSWAVITGGSSGQGRAFARQLARDGFHVLLVGSARSHAVAAQIRAETGRRAQVVVKDFADAFDADFFDEIEAAVRAVDCSILINNVGHRTGWMPTHEQPAEQLRATIACGTLVQARMTTLLLPRFIARASRASSCIVFITAQCMHRNLGFAIALPNEISIPYLAAYEASNSFGYYHACSIIKEYGGTQWLDLLNVTPGAVLTENTEDMLRDTPFAIGADQFVRNIRRFMGGNAQGTTCAHWGHAMANGLIALAPFVKDRVLLRVGQRIAAHCMRKSGGGGGGRAAPPAPQGEDDH